MTEPAAVAVTDNPGATFEVSVEGHLAFAAYHIAGGSIFFTHTEVPKALAAAASARPSSRRGSPPPASAVCRWCALCPFFAAWFGKHPEARDLLHPSIVRRWAPDRPRGRRPAPALPMAVSRSRLSRDLSGADHDLHRSHWCRRHPAVAGDRHDPLASVGGRSPSAPSSSDYPGRRDPRSLDPAARPVGWIVNLVVRSVGGMLGRAARWLRRSHDPSSSGSLAAAGGRGLFHRAGGQRPQRHCRGLRRHPTGQSLAEGSRR